MQTRPHVYRDSAAWEAQETMCMALVTLLLASLLAPPLALADAQIFCKVFALCWYESPGFHITVADKETGQPLAEVHALAVWLHYGGWGQKPALMALEAVSGSDGVLTFPGWGPLQGSQTGLVPARDPAIGLFKPGFRTLLIYNAGRPPGIKDTTRVRPFWRDGKVFELEPFRGTSEQWVEQLRQAAFNTEISAVSQYHSESIRDVYLSRWRRVKAEVEKLPQRQKEVEQLLWSLEGNIKVIAGGSTR